MKTSELEGTELDYWVAKAQGWELIDFLGDGEMYWNDPHSTYIKRKCGYHPTTNWAQCGELLEKFEMHLFRPSRWSPKNDIWGAMTNVHVDAVGEGHDQKTAICRAVVASKFGEEVSDD